VLDYKVEKKADGWYVAGERFSNQTSATRYLIALFTGKATPKKAAPKKAAASTPKKAAPKKEAAPERPVAGRVKLPELYPKGAGLVAGYVFTLTANGTQWSLAQGVRGRDIPAKADGRGNVVLASGAQISVTGLNIHRAGGDRTPAPAPAPVVLPALPPARQISPDKYARRVVPVQRERVRDTFPVLGGGLIETDEEGGAKHRPFVVVEVAPDKVRPFYMSTGTGGQTDSGEWNLFGGIAEQSGRVSLGWFIKPTEGKRVEKYAAVSAFLADKFGEDSDTAWRRIQRAVPGAKVYSELVGGELPTEETPRRVERRKRRRIMGGLLNSYLGKLNAIAAFQPDFEPEVGHRRSAGEHKTVYGAGRVAFNPRNPSEGERHISYEEQERRRKLYAPSREKAAERRRLRAALAILAEADLEAGRVAEARKKGASARPPKPVYTKEYLASKGMKRRNPLRMETDPFHPSNWAGNATKGALLFVYPKGKKERALRRGAVFIEPAASRKSGFPLVNLQIKYQTESAAYLDSEDGSIKKAPGHRLLLEYVFDTPEGRRVWRVSYGARRPATANEVYPDAPSSLVEAARVAARDFERIFGQARRNPLEAYRQTAPDGTTFQRVYVGRDATLDIEFSQTDWSHPGAPKTVRVLPSSRGHLGTLVRNLTNRRSTADEVLTAAVAAEASADDMFNAYPQYEFRSAARYYEALTEVLTEIAATLQRGWRS
jgi:hypothetical protein